MNQGKLRGLVYSKYKTAAKLAVSMRWGKQKLHRIMSGKQEPDLSDIHDLSNALNTPYTTLVNIFTEEGG